MPGAKRWSKKEVRNLLMGAGAFGIEWLRKQTGSPKEGVKHRSRQAIASKNWKEGMGGFTRGANSLRDAEKATGFTRSQLFRAMNALGQKWKRTGARGHYLVTDEQLEELCIWLTHDYWSKPKHLYACTKCGTSERKHFRYGLCERCFKQYYRLCKTIPIPFSTGRQWEVLIKLKQSGKLTVVERQLLDRISICLKKGLAINDTQAWWLGRTWQLYSSKYPKKICTG